MPRADDCQWEYTLVHDRTALMLQNESRSPGAYASRSTVCHAVPVTPREAPARTSHHHGRDAAAPPGAEGVARVVARSGPVVVVVTTRG